MYSNKTITDKIFSDYERDRAEAEVERQRRIDEVYARVPEIKKIDVQINRAGFELVKKIMKEPQNAESLKRELNMTVERLNSERKRLFAENNIPEDCFKIKYKCPMCKDTGYIGTQKCQCFIKKITQETYRVSNMSELVKTQNFDNFSFEYYTGEALEKMKNIHSMAVKYCENFENEKKGVLMTGAVGLGKTFLSSCMAKAIMDKGYFVIYMRTARIFEIMEENRFGRADAASAEMLEKINSCDLLIMDDLGAEIRNSVTNAMFFDLISERLINGKKMIINTNYSINQLTEIYTARTTSRLYLHFYLYNFIGSDIRVQQLYK